MRIVLNVLFYVLPISANDTIILLVIQTSNLHFIFGSSYSPAPETVCCQAPDDTILEVSLTFLSYALPSLLLTQFRPSPKHSDCSAQSLHFLSIHLSKAQSCPAHPLLVSPHSPKIKPSCTHFVQSCLLPPSSPVHCCCLTFYVLVQEKSFITPYCLELSSHIESHLYLFKYNFSQII